MYVHVLYALYKYMLIRMHVRTYCTYNYVYIYTVCMTLCAVYCMCAAYTGVL